MLQIGDIVRRLPSVHVDDCGRRIGGTVKAAVVYIHPKGRYHVVRFDFPGGSFRESFRGVEP